MKITLKFAIAALILALAFSITPAPTASAQTTCYWAQFIADVTVPDGTNYAPGATFVKTWRLKNIGSCTWTSADVSLKFDSGEMMGAPYSVAIPATVYPGQTVDISVNMTAPSTAGHYFGYYKFQTSSGATFGIGSSANRTFWVEIYVNSSSSGGTGTVIGTGYDFTANAASALWASGTGSMGFPGIDGSASGFGLTRANPQFENGLASTQAGLLFAPNNITNGYIQAVYPAFRVQSGDRFQATLGCEYGATSCYVTYRLDYQISGGAIRTFWTFREKYEGQSYFANLDLSSLAGQDVNFILVISAYGSPTGDRALWGAPIISRSGWTTATITPAPTTCDRAQLVADVTVPDGTTFAPSVSFTKTWRVQNVGSCTWTTSYALLYDSGTQMGGPASVQMPANVAPGQTVDISVNLISPGVGGYYSGYWKFKSPSGVIFGTGSSATQSLWVNIAVSGASNSGAAYDFAANACSAVWYSGAGQLPCPGGEGDARGFVLKTAPSKLENGVSDSRMGLLTYPQNITDGYIQGYYPLYTVKSGDRFRSTVNCEYNATSCRVVFRLDYQLNGTSAVQTFWAFVENYEGQIYQADIDLAPLVGQNVKFVLTILSTGAPYGDRALWVAPMIYNSGIITTSTPTLTPSPTFTPTPIFSPTPTVTSAPGASTTAITLLSPNPSVLLQSVAVSVTVSGAGTAPTGTVAITGADTNCSITLSAGSGTCNVIFSSVGAKTLTATYGGSGSYAGSSNSTSHTVKNAATTTITSDTPDPSTTGQAVTVNVTVGGAGSTPTGTVTIGGADTNCTITLSSGSGSCNAVFNTVGSKTLTATYNGDANYVSSAVASASHTVSQASATTTITADTPDPSTPNQTVSVTVSMSGSGAAPTGTVALTGADTNCTITLSSGSGSCNVVFATIGTKTITATYSGDSNYSSSSTTTTHTVQNAATITITADTPDPSTPSQLVTVNFTVSSVAGSAIPTGTVTISGADVTCAAVALDATGKGSCALVTFNTAGAKTLTATYSGDVNYAGSSGTASHTVLQGSTTTTVTTVTPSSVNATFTVNVTVTGGSIAPTGTVSISEAGVTLCTITLSAGTGSCSTASFATVGSKTVTATYSGDSNYIGSSDTTIHVVQ